jgi:hypothetical protein
MTKNKQVKNQLIKEKRTKLDPTYINNAITVPSYSVSRTHKIKQTNETSMPIINNNNKSDLQINLLENTHNSKSNLSSSLSINNSLQNNNNKNSSNNNLLQNSSNSSSSKNKNKKDNNLQTSINIESINKHRRDSNNKYISKSNNNKSVRNIILSIGITCLICIVFIKNNENLLSKITGNKIQARYIRSVSSQQQQQQQNLQQSNQDLQLLNNENDITNNNENNIILKVINGVTEIYNNHFSPTIQNIINSGSIDQLRQTDLSSLSKNGKLHYVPSSGFDPSKTAHHVLEGAGYRLNIPSYVQNVPDNNNEQQQQQQNSLNSESDSNNNLKK